MKGWENDLLPGDMILVETKYGVRKIVITKIEWLEKCPVDMPVKRVVKKIGREEVLYDNARTFSKRAKMEWHE